MKEQLLSVIRHKIFGGAIWLYFDNFGRLAINIGVLILVARYLGPADFGLLNYATAVVALFLALAAFGGRRDLMTRVAPSGPVYQAGTYAAHPLSVAAGLAMLDAIDARPDLYDALERTGAALEEGLRAAAALASVPVSVQRVGSMWTVFFSPRPVRSWDDAAMVDRVAHGRFFRAMLARGVLLPPSAFESAFLSAAHDDAAIVRTLEAARAAFQETHS